MPTKSKSKGGKRKKDLNKGGAGTKRDLLLKEEGQEYAMVLRMLGNGRLEAYCYDGKTRLATIRGKMRRKVWINQGDTILLGLRDYQDDKADVIHKFLPEEVRELKKTGEIPQDAKINESGFEFTGEEEEEDANMPNIEFTDL
jgi:translation initiation factor 1A